VFVYSIDGPLFFGAAHRAIAALGIVADRARVMIFRMEGVPHVDATGLVALESAIADLERHGCLVILTGVPREARLLIRKAGIREKFKKLVIREGVEEALLAADRHLAGH